MAEHATFAAIMPSLFLPIAVEFRLLAAVDVVSVPGFEPRAIGIDHPPQLIG